VLQGLLQENPAKLLRICQQYELLWACALEPNAGPPGGPKTMSVFGLGGGAARDAVYRRLRRVLDRRPKAGSEAWTAYVAEQRHAYRLNLLRIHRAQHVHRHTYVAGRSFVDPEQLFRLWLCTVAQG